MEIILRKNKNECSVNEIIERNEFKKIRVNEYLDNFSKRHGLFFNVHIYSKNGKLYYFQKWINEFSQIILREIKL